MHRHGNSQSGIARCRTTALREAENYGLRGWISTRSDDLAPAQAKCIRGAVGRERIVQHFQPSGENALGLCL
jgi:hypothetical protein